MSLLADIPATKDIVLSKDAKQCAAILEKQCALAGIPLLPSQLWQFSVYFELLTETNKVMNLTALTSPEER